MIGSLAPERKWALSPSHIVCGRGVSRSVTAQMRTSMKFDRGPWQFDGAGPTAATLYTPPSPAFFTTICSVSFPGSRTSSLYHQYFTAPVAVLALSVIESVFGP